jgi:hypothetical protein
MVVESDLIDEYVRGGLTDAERRRFEQRFLASAERRRKVEFARALARIASAPATEEVVRPATIHWWDNLIASLRSLSPVLQFSMAASALLLLLGLSWLITETVRLRAQVAQLQAEQGARQHQEEALRRQAAGERVRREDLAVQLEREQERREDLARQLERDRAQGRSTGATFIASLFLPPGVSRGGAERPQLVIPPAARSVRLQIGLEREDEYQSYRVELRTVQGQEVWTGGNLRPRQSRGSRAVNLVIPGSAFRGGKYELTLKGVVDPQKSEEVRFYYFDVLKK